MITRGIIKKVPTGISQEINGNQIVDNKYLVEIPTFKTSNNTTQTNSSQFISEAILCYTPGNLNSYGVGDVVFLYVGDPEVLPVIMGKLYLGEEEPRNYSKASTLYVSDKATLPNNTTIGSVTYDKLEKIYKDLSNVENILVNNGVVDLANTISEIEGDISDLSNTMVHKTSGTITVNSLNTTTIAQLIDSHPDIQLWFITSTTQSATVVPVFYYVTYNKIQSWWQLSLYYINTSQNIAVVSDGTTLHYSYIS